MKTLTTNQNFLSPVGFKFIIDNTLYPNLEYFCTGVTLPSLTLSEAPTPYRGVNFGVTGDRLTFDDLTIRFNVTENMENYIETFEWIQNIVNGGEDYKSDAILSVLSSHNNVTKQIKFIDIFPISLSAVEFSTQQTDIEYVQADVTFKYSYFEIL